MLVWLYKINVMEFICLILTYWSILFDIEIDDEQKPTKLSDNDSGSPKIGENPGYWSF